MNKVAAILFALIVLVGSATPVALAQNNGDAQGAAGCAACAGCGTVGIVIFFGLIALNIALLVWVARDAKNRGMESPILWMLLVLVTGLVGLIIYFFVRPKGDVIECPHCKNKRLRALATCPHCAKP